MLNLIKNEYSKIFHKKSSYILLIFLLLFIVGLPLGSKFLSNAFSNDYMYYSDIDDEIRYAKDSNDTAYLEQLQQAKDLDLTIKDLYSGESWRGTALTDVFYNCKSVLDDTSSSISDEQKANLQQEFDSTISAIKKNDWKAYYKIKINAIYNTPDYDEDTKSLLVSQYQDLIKNNISPDDKPWQLELLTSYYPTYEAYNLLVDNKEKGLDVDEKEFQSAESQYLMTKYRLKNDVKSVIYKGDEEMVGTGADSYVYSGNLFNCLKNGTSIFSLIGLIGIIIAGTIISKEFSQGTIKFLLINPVKRYKIFWSKYLTVISYTFALSLITFLLEILFSSLTFGFSELGTSLLVVENGAVNAQSGLVFILQLYMLSFVTVFVCVTIAFMLSSLFRNSALAIALGILTYTMGPTIASIGSAFSIDPLRYTIFSSLDITSIAFGSFPFYGMTMSFSVAIILIHLFLMLFIAHDSFTKKDV